MDNAETNLYFLQVVAYTLDDVPKLYLFSLCKDFVGKNYHESKAVKLLVDEVVYIRQKATNAPAIFEMLYKSVIDNSDILLLMDKDRESEYYKIGYTGMPNMPTFEFIQAAQKDTFAISRYITDLVK